MTRMLMLAAALAAAPALAQNATNGTTTDSSKPTAGADSIQKPAATATSRKALLYKAQVIQHMRFNDQRGLNVFEAPKEEGVAFTGFKLDFGAAFAQQFQGLDHRNTADSVATSATSKVNANRLIPIGHGFNNAMANLYINAQLAKGVRVAMTSYLSTRHHNETWVKDGYFLIDDSPIDLAPLNRLMQYVTVKAGHFEINYGDEHFRRTDAGQALYNPLVGNLLMDAFTTQVGGELYVRKSGLLAMGAVTNGEVRGTILNAGKRAPAFIGKLGYDGQVTKLVRVRLTGSAFDQTKSANQTLYTGSRAGSRYYDVIENTASTEAAQAWSGDVRPDFNEVHARVINPFVKVGGLELFGNLERTTGRTAAEQAAKADVRTVTQNAYELTYRFLGDQLYVSGRTNSAKGRFLSTLTSDATVTRNNVGGGWFITPTVMLKGEYVKQTYDGFGKKDIRNGAKFDGFMLEGVVSF